MNSPNILPAPCDTLVTKYHHHTPSVTEPPRAATTITPAENPFCAASAPPIRAPATTGMIRELTVCRKCAASRPRRSKSVRLYSSPLPAFIVLDYLGP